LACSTATTAWGIGVGVADGVSDDVAIGGTAVGDAGRGVVVAVGEAVLVGEAVPVGEAVALEVTVGGGVVVSVAVGAAWIKAVGDTACPITAVGVGVAGDRARTISPMPTIPARSASRTPASTQRGRRGLVGVGLAREASGAILVAGSGAGGSGAGGTSSASLAI
jgi:hypothetical protein